MNCEIKPLFLGSHSKRYSYKGISFKCQYLICFFKEESNITNFSLNDFGQIFSISNLFVKLCDFVLSVMTPYIKYLPEAVYFGKSRSLAEIL